jgi:hypothetical protein
MWDNHRRSHVFVKLWLVKRNMLMLQPSRGLIFAPHLYTSDLRV